MKYIESKKGLTTLLKRCEEKGLTEAVETIKGCLKYNLAMDEMDYENLGKEYRKCCKGLK